MVAYGPLICGCNREWLFNRGVNIDHSITIDVPEWMAVAMGWLLRVTTAQRFHYSDVRESEVGPKKHFMFLYPPSRGVSL